MLTGKMMRKVSHQRLNFFRKRTSQAPISLEADSDKKINELSSKDQQRVQPADSKSCLPFESIPGPRPSLPFIGTAWQYFPGGRYSLSDLHEANDDKYRRYGPIIKEEFQWKKAMIQLYDPKDFETMFRQQSFKPTRPIAEFVKHYRLQHPDKYDSPGLANAIGDEWMILRKALAPVLMKLNAMGGLLPSMNNICNDFVELLRHERHPGDYLIPNLQNLTERMALEAIYMMTLENRLGCLEKDLSNNSAAKEMIWSVKTMFEAYQKLYFGLPIWKLFPTRAYKKLGEAEQAMYKATSNRIKEKLESLRTEPAENQNTDDKMPGVLHKLLHKTDLSDKEIITTIIDFLSGGIFTVSNSFSFLLYHLSRNQQVQEKLYREVREVAPDGEINLERLAKLNYLKACVKESFRLTPTIPGIARILPTDVVMSGYKVPAKTAMFTNFTVSCKNTNSFPNPEAYIPDRWIDGNDKNINKFSLVPFGFGCRMCVGRRFAEIEMYISLAKVIHNFRLEPSGEEVKSKMAFIIVPSRPVSLYVKDR